MTWCASLLALVLGAVAAGAAPWMQVNGVAGDYASFHYYIDEPAGQTDSVLIEFWPNQANVQKVELWSNLNNRDFATLNPPDPATVNPGDADRYFAAHSMSHDGKGRYHITMPISKCGAYRITCRYKLNGDANWRWAGVRDAAVVVSDVATRDMIMYELQVNAVDAKGDNYSSRSTFADLHDDTRFNLDYVKNLGVNTLWLMPFHPIGSKADGNHGEVGSPYSIKNMWRVAEILGKDGTRDGAMAEFKAFMAEAEEKGVNIMFDTIFNHTAKDAEVERDPNNPYLPAANPWQEIRDAKPHWYSKYSGNGSCSWTTDPGGSPPYEYWASAENKWQIGPAPADRHDFGKWCDASDLFWGTYSALGNPQNEDDGLWSASSEVRKMCEYFGYFAEYWLAETGNAIDGFRCDFAQGLPPQAWEYIINTAKSVKPELCFMAESLDGGAVSRRAARHFDVVNESWVWAMLGNGGNASGIRGIVDERKAAYGFAGVMRGLINHDQSAPANKWYTLSRYAVGCALDGSPQMFMGQELGYVDHWGFSRFRNEFDRWIPDIRNYYNLEALWNNQAADRNALWNRYAEVNQARQRSVALRLANQYYLDQVNGWGTHERIFAVMKYENYGWDAADQDVVICLVNLDPGSANSGTFKINVPAIYLNPSKKYNVRNLASSTPDKYLWTSAKTGSEIAGQGLFVSFPASVYQESSVAQFLKLEEQGSVQPELNVGNTSNWPRQGDVDPGEEVWLDTETWPIAQGQSVTAFYRINGGAWQSKAIAWHFNDTQRSHWHVNLGAFAAGATVQYYVEAKMGALTKVDDKAGAYYSFAVKQAPGVQWLGNTYHWPWSGEIDATDDLWINCQTYPKGAASHTRVVYSLNGGDWIEVGMSHDGFAGSNDKWHANLGKFSAGSTVQYFVEAEDGSVVKTDDNQGAYFIAKVNQGGNGKPVQWIGNTYHWPLNGQIDAGEMLWINIDTYPRGAAASARAVYSVDGGAWQSADLSPGSPVGNNDHWYLPLDAFASGQHIQYAIEVVDGTGASRWDNNKGMDFHALVN